MDEDTQQNGPVMNGDDELAKTLNGGLKFEETPPAQHDDAQADDSQPQSDDMPQGDMGMGDDQAITDDAQADGQTTASDGDDMPPTMGDLPKPQIADDEADSDEMDHDAQAAAPVASDLDSLKSSALDDLKPLVGKLNLSPEEKFDTLLLIIRSTDDQTMLAEAHEAAKAITDDTKRAQALLDIIKEVDYFNSKK